MRGLNSYEMFWFKDDMEVDFSIIIIIMQILSFLLYF